MCEPHGHFGIAVQGTHSSHAVAAQHWDMFGALLGQGRKQCVLVTGFRDSWTLVFAASALP